MPCPAKRSASPEQEEELLRLLLLLLTDADLGVQRLGILERLVIVAGHGVRQVLIDVGALGQDGHQSVAIVAGRAEGPEPLYIRNCHNFYSLTRRARLTLMNARGTPSSRSGSDLSPSVASGLRQHDLVIY